MSTGLKLSSKDDTFTRLVYRVNPLPDSMIPSIWDFNSLSDVDERKYIHKMVNKTFETTSL